MKRKEAGEEKTNPVEAKLFKKKVFLVILDQKSLDISRRGYFSEFPTLKLEC